MFKLGLTTKIECLSLAWAWYESINNVQAWAYKLIMPKIVNKLHNTHMLKTRPAKQQQRETLGEYWCGTGQRSSED